MITIVSITKRFHDLAEQSSILIQQLSTLPIFNLKGIDGVRSTIAQARNKLRELDAELSDMFQNAQEEAKAKLPPKCLFCEKVLTIPSPLIFSAPDANGMVKKIHACIGCYNSMLQRMKAVGF